MPSPPSPARRIRWRIGTVLLWLVLACLLPGMTGTGVLFAREYRSGIATLQRDVVATARAMTQTVDTRLLMARTTAQTLASTSALAHADLQAFHRRAREVIASTHVGMNVVVCDSSGQQLLNTLREWGEPLPRHGNPELLRQVFATGQPVISGVYIGGVLRRPVLGIDVPVIDQGRVIYDLTVGLLPSDFNAVLTVQKFPPDWVVAVFDAAGTIVARSHAPEKFVGQQGTPEFIRHIMQAPEGWTRSVTREGIPTLSIWSRSAATGWSVGIGIPEATLASELTGNLELLALGMSALLLLGLGLAWFAGRKIAVSVRALTAPALAMRSGQVIAVPALDIEESAEVAAAIDETARLLAERAAELKEVQRSAGFGVWRYALATGTAVVSESVREIFGREVPPFAEQRGTLLPIDSWEQLKAVNDEAARSGQGYDLELRVNHGNGSTVWINLKCMAVRDAAGKVVELRGSILDITARRRAELELEQSRQTYLRHLEQEVAARTASLVAANQELERLTRTDALTGLQNRHAANDRLRQEFLRLKRSGGAYAVLFIDIDRFKQINDGHGHEAGDQVLRQVAALLGQAVRATDVVARYGGEEFLVILPDTDADGALRIAEKIRGAVAGQPLPPVGRVSVSIGVTQALAEDRNEEEAVRRADQALYQAKASGRDRVCHC